VPILTFNAADHRYELDGFHAWSVTQLFHLVGLTRWDEVQPSRLETARIRGSVVHQAAHYYNENDFDVQDFEAECIATGHPEYIGFLRSWIRLRDTGRIEPVLCEHRVANVGPRYAGTFDLLCRFDGQAALLDYATGDPIDACKHLQTAAYVLAAKAWAQMNPDETVLRKFLDQFPTVQRYAVRLHPEGELPTLTHYTDSRDFSRFIMIATAVNLVEDERRSAIPWKWDDEPVGVR